MKGLVEALLDFIWKRAKEPDTIEDAQTLDKLKKQWNDYVADELKDKPDK